MQEFYFIRHGETDWNKQGLWQGSTDTDLNDDGRAQAEASILKLSDLGLTRIVTSPLKRCLQTTDIINTVLKLPVEQHENLRERCFGKLNGKHRDEIGDIEDYDPDEYQVERKTSVIQRATTVIEASFVKYPREKILFVSHGGVFRAVHVHFCGEEQKTGNAVPHHFFQKNGLWHSKTL